MTILLTQDQQATLKTISEIIQTPKGETYFYQPYYFKDIGNGQFERFTYAQLPADVKDLLLKQIGINI